MELKERLFRFSIATRTWFYAGFRMDIGDLSGNT
ncbi:hypothetical protein LINGRAHAP2_LOCUS25075 [Linum grandiflorum]